MEGGDGERVTRRRMKDGGRRAAVKREKEGIQWLKKLGWGREREREAKHNVRQLNTRYMKRMIRVRVGKKEEGDR